jgi:hypothetical protein
LRSAARHAPAGGFAGAARVRWAVRLCVDPLEFMTTTKYSPTSAAFTWLKDRFALLACGIGWPFFSH